MYNLLLLERRNIVRNIKICMFLLVLLTLSFPSKGDAAETNYSSSLRGNSGVKIVVVDKDDASNTPGSGAGNTTGDGGSKLPESGVGNSSEKGESSLLGSSVSAFSGFLLPKTGSVKSILYNFIGVWIILLIALWKKNKNNKENYLYVD